MINGISFEFFPPKTKEMEQKLKQSIGELIHLTPTFVSITYGAGGSARYKTHKIVSKLITETDLNVAAHLTCVNSSKDEISDVLGNYMNIGVNHIVALRGDMEDQQKFNPHPDGFRSSIGLIKFIKKKADIRISVSGYPENHPDSKGLKSDIDFLKAKIDSGADEIITQFCLKTESYHKYRDNLVKAGINVPIIPGIMLIKTFSGIKNMANKIGVEVTDFIKQTVEANHSSTEQKIISEEFAIQQTRELESNGFDNFHYYTLNDSRIIINIADDLGFYSLTK
tara:strand:+ start:175 stop:1020 length:846 start_codon:yes stop_codon:yes gene_type:complete